MMRIPTYWAKDTYTAPDRNGKQVSFSAWGWSFESMISAKKMAAEKAKNVWRRFDNHQTINSYEYLEQPLREEIIHTVKKGEDTIAIITRNRYGALVLNSASVLFADVDLPPLKTDGFLDSILLFFSSKRKAERIKQLEDERLEPIQQWSKHHPGRSFRIYRTAAGFRLLFTDQLYVPVSSDVQYLLKKLGSDDLYIKLTLKQVCFRARLTPKPWRCGCTCPPNRYPWENQKEEKKYRQWEKEYAACSESFGVCKLYGIYGHDSKNDQISTIIQLHDQYTCRPPELELA